MCVRIGELPIESSEVSAAASNELASQAANVNEIVGSLILLVEGAKTAHTNSRMLTSQSISNHEVRRVETKKGNLTALVSRAHAEAIIPLHNDF